MESNGKGTDRSGRRCYTRPDRLLGRAGDKRAARLLSAAASGNQNIPADFLGFIDSLNGIGAIMTC